VESRDEATAEAGLRSIRGLTAWTTGLLIAGGFVAIFAMDYLVFDLHSLHAQEQGIPMATQLGRARTWLTDTGIAGLIVFLVLVPLWLAWQYRAHANLRVLGARDLTFRPVAAVAVWFVPVVNLLVPLLAMRELWMASDPEASAEDWRGRATPALLPFWWLALVAAAGLGFLAGRAAWVPNPTLQQLIARDIYLMVGFGVLLAATLLTIVLIRMIESRQFVRRNRITNPDQLWAGWGRRSSRDR
jgi:hypothetical protein